MKLKLVSICLLAIISIVISCNKSGALESNNFKTFSIPSKIYNTQIVMKSKTFKSHYTNEKIRLDITFIG